jgi:hypothetical protein
VKFGRVITAALIVFALCALPMAIYSASYLWLGRAYWSMQGTYVGGQLLSEPVLVREYPQEWQVTLFLPLGKLESLLRRQEVDVRPRPPTISL